MSTNDPIDEILDKAAAFHRILNAPARPLPPDLLAEVNAMFSKPVSSAESTPSDHVLTSQEVTSLLLMVISQQSMSTLELVEALKRQNVVFEGGHGIIFRFLQQLELQGYLRSEKKPRRGRELKVYSATEDGRALVQQTASNEQTLYSLATQLSAGITLA